MHLPSVAAAALLALACLPVAAQNLKPGLWEVRHKMNNPQMDAAMAEMRKQLANMPPQQRKQMEAAMAQHGVRMAPGQDGAMAMQVCMTKEMIERNEMPLEQGCTMTRNQRSGNSLRFAFSCTNPPSSGEGEVSFQGSEAYTNRMTVTTTTSKGRTETMQMEGSGRFLKADCGNLKPPAR